MRGRILVIAALLVAGLLGALLWATRRDTGKPATVAAPVDEPAAPDTPAPLPRQARPLPESAPTSSPPPVEPAAPAPPSEERTRITHDHSGDPPARKSPLTPDTIFAARQVITPDVKSCIEPLVRAGRKSLMTVVAKVTISAGKVATSEPVVSHPDFKDTAFDECVGKAFTRTGLDAPAGQTDTVYKVAMTFPIE